MYNSNVRDELKKKFPNCEVPWCNSIEHTEEFKNTRLMIDGNEVWACAYQTNYSEKSMRTMQKPVLGVIKKENRKWRFFPYGKEGKLLKSRGVQIESRVFADTEEESKEIYNFLVNKQLELLNKLIEKTKEDLI